MYVSHVLDRQLLNVTVTKIAGYVRARVLMIREFVCIFRIHSFLVMAILVN